MIIINFKGGLGNQLFQYAAGRSLSLKNNDILKFDTTGYAQIRSGITIREFGLSHFNVHGEIATPDEIKGIKYPYGFLSKAIRLYKAKILRQFNITYNPRVMMQRKDVYLDGFFQDERYFIQYEKEIRADLNLKNTLSKQSQEILESVRTTAQSVSFHVRRGDYVKDPKTNEVHGTCSDEYYTNALQHITSKVGTDITIFVFSDDIEWVKDNITPPFPTIYVSSPDIKDYEELILMSNCRHNIIANSSFSWWGAWLNPATDKIVVAPKKWVANDSSIDPVPATWVRM